MTPAALHTVNDEIPPQKWFRSVSSMTQTSSTTVGAAVLLANSANGWQPAALLLPSPILLLRFSEGVSRVYQAGFAAPFLTREGSPLVLLEEILAALKKHVPAAGPKAGKPAFPMATIAATYEFGQRFAPHEGAFPHAAKLEDDEFFASIFMDAYRPDAKGETERIGYAGAIPADWLPGAPALATRPWGHDAPPVTPWPIDVERPGIPFHAAVSRDDYNASFDRILAYLAAGDCYQVNYTIPFTGATSAPVEEIFDAGLEAGGAAYGATFLTPTGTVVCFSPELLLRRRGPEVQTRPIKGTRPIHSREELEEARQSLLRSDKDRAEHLMIVDLERNDLGRVCHAGSIKPDPFMEAVEHPTVMHLESTVRGMLKPFATLEKIFAAIFPGGSVTGAPKKRAMEIIGELEWAPRGVYCGALGWVDCEGDCELALPIRTAIIRPDGRYDYHAGGGIVADSRASEEWEEVRAKTAFFEKVLAEAEKRSQYDATDHH